MFLKLILLEDQEDVDVTGRGRAAGEAAEHTTPRNLRNHALGFPHQPTEDIHLPAMHFEALAEFPELIAFSDAGQRPNDALGDILALLWFTGENPPHQEAVHVRMRGIREEISADSSPN